MFKMKDRFIEHISNLYEVTDLNEIHLNAKYKELDEWDSLLALEIIAMIDEEFNVELNGDDIRNTETLEDLLNLVESRSQDV